ncbi:MAG: hypothetical protein HKP60_11435 [Eudoraea sp.]|nr:hypothetical protein [Eudoraea sp.]NNJ41472.1 hypothetical protein [Eudoraea sp.]
MNFKPQLSLMLICLFAQAAIAKSNCEDAYTSASYGLSHSKKAFKANNFDHQQYYAGRALDALEKTRDQVNNCGCDGALVSIASGIENLEKALDPKDWDMGRYFTKRAIADAYSVLENLDLCSTPDETSSSEPKDGISETDNTASTAEEKAAYVQALDELEAAALTELKQLDQTVKKLSELLDCEVPQFSMDQIKAKYDGQAQSESMNELQEQLIEDARSLYRQALDAIEACWENK